MNVDSNIHITQSLSLWKFFSRPGS